MTTWIDRLQEFCRRYNLDVEHLAEVLNDPKVIPMIRGKSFEFTVSKHLREILPNRYQVTNPRLNAQTGLQDIDVYLVDRETNQTFSIECKLAAKGSFRLDAQKSPYVKVKCMRSRTLGEDAAQQRAKITGIPFELLKIHNDQYTAREFDLVITSIANAFYETDVDGLFYWSPPPEAASFLEMLGISGQEEAFFKLYVARSRDLAANSENGILCTRKKCKAGNWKDCNFIPNYPMLKFDRDTGMPLAPWLPIENIQELLR